MYVHTQQLIPRTARIIARSQKAQIVNQKLDLPISFGSVASRLEYK